jgi:hypothetical protein
MGRLKTTDGSTDIQYHYLFYYLLIAADHAGHYEHDDRNNEKQPKRKIRHRRTPIKCFYALIMSFRPLRSQDLSNRAA